MKLELTDKQRTQIIRSTYPAIPLSTEQAKALAVGECIIVAPANTRDMKKAKVWIEIRGARRERKKGWFLEYTIRDDRPRFMRRGQGYTHSLALAVANEDTEAVPEEYQRELTTEAHRRMDEFDRENRIEALAKQDMQRLNAEIRELAKRAIKMGLDPAVALAPIAKVVEQQHSGLKDAA